MQCKMIVGETKKQPSRNIKSFEPSPDVARMLERASRDGIKVTHILDSAAREWLTKKGYARKKDLAAV